MPLMRFMEGVIVDEVYEGKSNLQDRQVCNE